MLCSRSTSRSIAQICSFYMHTPMPWPEMLAHIPLSCLAETSAMQQELKSQQCSGLQILHARYDAKAANARAQSLEQQAEGSVALCKHLAARLSAVILLERKQAA